MTELYQAEVTVTGGRDGRAVSADGLLDARLASPRALGGAGDAPNPEQLFAAGFAACLNSSIRLAARGLGLDEGEVVVRARVGLLREEDGAFGIAATLAAEAPGLAPGDRERVLAEAWRVCAYSNALKGTARVEVTMG